MTTTDRRTRAQLIDALAQAQADRDEAIADEEAAREALADLDLEAKIIAGCVAHLDLFPAKTTGRSLASAYAFDDIPPQRDPGDPRVVRVLGYLAARYGLPDPRVEVEQLNDELGRVNAELHRTRCERDELRERIARLQDPDPRF